MDRIGRNCGRAAAAIALLCAGFIGAAPEEGGAAEASDVGPAPVHRDAAGLEEAALEATRAFLREDAASARKVLDRMENLSRRLPEDEREEWGTNIVSYDQAFHLTLDRAREMSSRGEIEAAFDQFVWVQRSCRACHKLARESGAMPPLEPER